MTATIFHSRLKEERWAWMIALSFLFHLMIFSTVLFIPQTPIRFPSMKERVYHVELVGSSPRVKDGVKAGSPSGVRNGVKGGGGIARTKETSRILETKTRRIDIRKKRSVSILAKRVSPNLKPVYRNEVPSDSGLIDRAISKIERNVEEEKTAQPEKILGKPEGISKGLSKGGEGGGLPWMSSGIGKIIQLYQIEIESAIKNNWSYPVTLLNLKKDRAPEAVVIVIVQSDGKILKAWFKKRSNNRLFDDSVLKAIEKSDPLPKFPPGYRKGYDEVEINFSLKDLV